jgi:hypothetical protein
MSRMQVTTHAAWTRPNASARGALGLHSRACVNTSAAHRVDGHADDDADDVAPHAAEAAAQLGEHLPSVKCGGEGTVD